MNDAASIVKVLVITYAFVTALHGQNLIWSVSEKWITPGTSYAIVGDFIDAKVNHDATDVCVETS